MKTIALSIGLAALGVWLLFPAIAALVRVFAPLSAALGGAA